jgi:hypothetical protein
MMPAPDIAIPLARDDPPWVDCGDTRDPDFGTVFPWPAAGAAVALTYDRAGRWHAATLLRGGPGKEIVLHGRRFRVAGGHLPPVADR